MYSFKQVFGIIKKNSIFLKKKSQSPKPGHGSKAASTNYCLNLKVRLMAFKDAWEVGDSCTLARLG
jgi:hypothetical protein